MNKIPLELYMWWEDLGESGQDKVNRYLGGLIGLLKIKPIGDIIKALVTFWDPAHNVFHFSDFELTPTLEEIAGYIGSTEAPLRHKYLIAPRVIAAHTFLDFLKISRGSITQICKGNFLKWEEHRCFAFMVVFLGLLVFPRKDGNIDTWIAGVVSTLLTQAKSTLAPTIVSEIFRAITACKARGDFFEGCNLLLQMWMIEHLCHRRQYLNYGSTEKSCIEEFYTRVDGFSMPEGVTKWISCLHSVTANQIEWTFGWLPIDEIIYMPTTGPHLLLMGLRSIHPYAPNRVLRQLGRFQKVSKDEDLSTQVVEIGSNGQFHEATVFQIWSKCQYLTASTQVCDLSKGEVSHGYLAWYQRSVEFGRPTKRPRLQEYVEASHAQWDWLAKENEYRDTISKLEKQVKNLKFENSLQAAADEGEKKEIAKENDALRA
ncbi:uncharacterized protein [Nicotiana sylvestris]|uniref:uncharacterized protein n=1 Tax=Nicotiana sylvestris TaxID=4096 RepID=UPI00388CC141